MPGELSPGSTKRRWIPEGGEQRLRDRIHKESKFVDDHKNLPFTFAKLEDIDLWISEKGLSPEIVKEAKKNKVQLL